MGDIIKFERRDSPPPSADFDTARAIQQCENMLEELSKLEFGELQPVYATHLFIHLHDLAQRAKAIGQEITFTSDIQQTNGVVNVTDLISKLRNAVCHIRSPTRNIGEGSFVFNRIYGYMPNAFGTKDANYGCDYADDIGVYYGVYRFYLRRHGRRILDDLRVIFSSAR